MNPVFDLLGKKPEQIAKTVGRACPVTPDNPLPGEDRHIELPELGLSVVLGPDSTADTVQLHGPGRSTDYASFQGEFVPGLHFGSSRDEARAMLGAPVKSESGGPGRGLFGTYLKPWDRFETGAYSIHFEYGQDADRIILVSISESQNK